MRSLEVTGEEEEGEARGEKAKERIRSRTSKGTRRGGDIVERLERGGCYEWEMEGD